MTFKEMLDIYIQAFIEQGAEPGAGLVNRNKVKVIENIKATLADRVLSMDTLHEAIKEVEFETENGTPVVAIDDLFIQLEEVGIKCR